MDRSRVTQVSRIFMNCQRAKARFSEYFPNVFDRSQASRGRTLPFQRISQESWGHVFSLSMSSNKTSSASNQRALSVLLEHILHPDILMSKDSSLLSSTSEIDDKHNRTTKAHELTYCSDINKTNTFSRIGGDDGLAMSFRRKQLGTLASPSIFSATRKRRDVSATFAAPVSSFSPFLSHSLSLRTSFVNSVKASSPPTRGRYGTRATFIIFILCLPEAA